MMPIAAGVSAAAGLAQGIVGALPTRYDKLRKKEENRLTALQAAGQLGLTDSERAARERDLMAPQRAAMAQSGTDQARLLAAANGSSSGADLSRIRSEVSRNLGGAAAQTASYLDQASEQKKGQQLGKLDAIRATEEARRTDRVNGLFSGISQAASAAGGIAGSSPDFSKAAAMGGGPAFNARGTMEQMGLSGLPADHASAVTTLLSQPGAQGWVRQAAAGKNLDDPNVAYIRQIMIDAQANRSAAGGLTAWTNSDSALSALTGNNTLPPAAP